MKLSAQQIASVKEQTSAEPVAEDSPAHGQLVEAFGDHTFYLSEHGLLTPEVVSEPEDENKTVELILIAGWAGENNDALQGVEPQRTGFELNVDGNAPDAAND